MNATITRRAALAGAIPAAAAATLPAMGAAIAIADVCHPDATLLAMEGRLKAIYVLWIAALDEQAIAERGFWAEKPKQPVYPDESGVKRDPLERVDAFANYRIELDVWAAETARLNEKHGFDAAREHAYELCADFMATFCEVAEMPARTLAGVQFKAQWVEHETPHANETKMRDSIVRDILAMAANNMPA